MKPVKSPLKLSDRGPEVTNLQDALKFLIDRRAIRMPESDGTSLTERLARDREQEFYGDSGTYPVVQLFQKQHGIDQTGGLDELTANAINKLLLELSGLDGTPPSKFVVHGQVRYADGQPAARLMVRAFDKDLRREEPLGEALTDAEGKYEIRYSPVQFQRAEKGKADLRVAVCNSDSDEPKTSDIHFNAAAEATIDLALPPSGSRPSEYERYMAELEPVLEGVALVDIADEKPEDRNRDLDFLAGDTGIDRQHIAWLIQAAGFEAKTKSTNPDVHVAVTSRTVPAEVFYAWFRRGLPVEWEMLISQPAALLKRALLSAIDENIVPQWLKDEADQIVQSLPSPHRRNLEELGRDSGLSVSVLSRLTPRLDKIELIDDKSLSHLVDEGVLPASDARSLGLGISLQRLAGLYTSSVAKVRALLPKDGESAVGSAPDLARLDHADWVRLLQNVSSEDDSSIDTHAHQVETDLAQAFPKVAFEFRATRLPSGIDQYIEQLQPILATGNAGDARPMTPAARTESESDTVAVNEARDVVTQLANLHPGLELMETIRAANSPVDAVSAVSERIGWMRKLFEMNKGVDLLSADLTPDSADLRNLNFDGLEESAKTKLLANLRAHHRVNAITRNVVKSEIVMKGGYHSAAALKRARPPELVALGLTESEAQMVLRESTEVADRAALLWFGVHTLVRDKDMIPFQPLPTEDEFFAKLPGYAELFGKQSICRCEHCQSILSPAAYFVDLMRYIERNILADSFKGNESHPLHLKVRRPDLWTLPLSCENTNKYIPYLDVINEVLETYIKSRKQIKDIAIFYRDLATKENSFKQPFHWALEKLAVYLQHFSTSRLDIAKLLNAAPEAQARARLGLSLKEYQIIATDPAFGFPVREDLRRYFEALFRVTQVPPGSADALLQPQDLQVLSQATGLDRDVCGSVLKALFVSVDGSNNSQIEILTGISNPANVQNDMEQVRNLSIRRLNRINRFIRLWKRLPWTVGELDAVLTSFNTSGLARDINPVALQGVVEILAAQDAAKLAVDEALAMSGNIPAEAMRDKMSLFDQRFNPDSFVSQDGRWPKPGVRFVHAAFNTAKPGVSLPDALATHRLLSALQVSDQDLVDLLRELLEPLAGPKPEPVNSFELKAENLAVLYRHARAARALGVSPESLFALIRLTPEIVAPSVSDTVKRIRSISDVLAIARFQQWQKACGFDVDQIAYLVGGGPHQDQPSVIPTNTAGQLLASDVMSAIVAKNVGIDIDDQFVVEQLSTDILSATIAERSLEFVDTVFTQIGLSEEHSRKVVQDNLSTNIQNRAFEAATTAGAYRLTDGFDPASNIATLNISGDISLLDARGKIQTVLQGYSPWSVLVARLSAKLAISAERLEGLVTILRSQMSAANIRSITRAIKNDSSKTALNTLIRRVLRYALLLNSSVFTPKTLQYIATKAPGPQKEIFGLGETLNVQTIQRIAIYVQLATAPDRSFTGAGADPDISALHTAIDHIIAGNATSSEIAAALGAAEPSVKPLLPTLALFPSNPLDRLRAIRALLDLVGKLGLNGETVRFMASDNYDELSRAADGVLAAFRSKYTDEKTFLDKLEPFDDKLRGRKRDALVDYMTTEWRLPFASPTALYQYFLLDVELEGCARTSKIVAANSSLQLYVQRVLMNLERSEDGNVTASFGNVKQDDVRNNIAEWIWRKHYRVWEANRKVFLFPENYIEPELRDDKSHLFKELEDTLLQQQISEQAILDAYAKYLTGFEELANLTVAGAHLEYRGISGSRLHVFAASSSDPPTFYYRVIDAVDSERPIFHNWSKVNVQIPVRKVSLVVYLGQLYVFWVNITTRPETSFQDGNSEFVGYIHKISVFYSVLRLDNTWSAPQRLSIRYTGTTDNAAALDVTESAAALDAAVTVPDPRKDKGEDSQIKFPWGVTINIPTEDSFTPRYDTVVHPNPIEGYTLRGDQWQVAFPSIVDDELLLTMRNFRMTGIVDVGLNLYTVLDPVRDRQKLLSIADVHSVLRLKPAGQQFMQVFHEHVVASDWSLYLTHLAARNAVIDQGTQNIISQYDKGVPDQINLSLLLDLLLLEISNQTSIFSIARWVNPRLLPASSHSTDALLTCNDGDLYLVHPVSTTPTYRLHRLGTSVSRRLRWYLGRGGINGLLSLSTQIDLHETPLALAASTTLLVGGSDKPGGIRDPFVGAYGSYMEEIFFQLPFLIANHLNSQQKFAASQRWYHYIFDPTATDNPSRIVYDPNDNPVEWFPNSTDRPWRYLGFRNLHSVGLRYMMMDEKALAAYRNDPFNPHAIARLRPSAYQKSIVMKYIDNLLDWGDQLFTQFTMESVNEATMLYVMAADILGPRAAEVGECGQGDPTARTYEAISREAKAKSDDFLIELEPLTLSEKVNGSELKYVVELRETQEAAVTRSLVVRKTPSAQSVMAAVMTNGAEPLVEMNWNKAAGGYWSSSTGIPLNDVQGRGRSDPVITGTPSPTALSFSIPGGTERAAGPDAKILDNPTQSNGKNHGKPHPSDLVPSKLVFCIPDNKELRSYWDRVEDRLFKIRNCMDIAGVRRRLELFSPEIDPRLLVRLKAAGLSIEDVLATTSGEVPPYRFAYLIDKAKQYAATLQGFGGQLLSAIEKRDAEELNRLRIIHEQNLLKQRREAMEWEVNAADDTLESLNRQKTAAEYRRDHYQRLGGDGLSLWERAQQIHLHMASALEPIAAMLSSVSSAAHLAPQLGAPTALKYGGKEIGDSLFRWSITVNTLASTAKSYSQSAGIEASFQRRDEDWKHQAEMARRDLDQIQKQISAAQFRQQIAKRSLEVHQKTIDQTEEVFNLYRDHFSNLGRFTWLSTQLHRLYRLAFNSAFSMARLAEQAYRFERDEDVSSTLLGGNYWETESAGLLAGEQLMLDLQTMERRFIETNYRKLEITQSFSVLQFAPDKLIKLRENGSCTFTVPEVFFDLYYPGHYKRIIKAVRLTIPCIVGPYTNVGATLRLKSSKIQNASKKTASPPPVPLRHTVSVAVSTAQNDAGVFEFGFRDERYMPFEGAGAIDSEWEVTLPNGYRVFDYHTISDVILHISYTASESHDSASREEVEARNAQLTTMLQALPPMRLFSMRSEFPSAWAKFKNQKNAFAELKIELDSRHYPFWCQGSLNGVVKAELYAKTTAATLSIAAKADGSGERDNITQRDGKLLKGELTNNKPQSPVGPLTLYLNDKSIDDLWLLIAWH